MKLIANRCVSGCDRRTTSVQQMGAGLVVLRYGIHNKQYVKIDVATI
jgi:hypothetical protein